MNQTRYLEGVQEIIATSETIFNNTNDIKDVGGVPKNETDFPLSENHWLKVPDVICIFVDIRNSTGLSATSHDQSTAAIYEFFTGTAVKLFHHFEAAYLDIKGDGVFALFNKEQTFRSLAAVVSFKTFADTVFIPTVKMKLKRKVEVGCHMGVDQKTVLVKQVGLRDAEGRDRRKNEVWAGKPINMAAKLASLSSDGELLVSDRFFNSLGTNDLVLLSCGCTIGQQTKGDKAELWSPVDVSDKKQFDFDKAYSLKSLWCEQHGKLYCENILKLDK